MFEVYVCCVDADIFDVVLVVWFAIDLVFFVYILFGGSMFAVVDVLMYDVYGCFFYFKVKSKVKVKVKVLNKMLCLRR